MLYATVAVATLPDGWWWEVVFEAVTGLGALWPYDESCFGEVWAGD